MTVAAGSGFGGKPRPALVVQSDAFATADTVILALFTTTLTGAAMVRPLYEPSPENGLQQPSELMTDILVTARRTNVGRVIGRLSPAELARADRILVALLGLG